MSFTFSADEVYEIAERIEINGSAFYGKASERVTDAESRELFSSLADQEMEHYETFTALREGLGTAADSPAGMDVDEDAQAYLNSFADDALFSDATVDFSSVTAILKAAIAREAESVKFYERLRGLVAGEAERAKVDAIIAEEKTHVRLLTERLRG